MRCPAKLGLGFVVVIAFLVLAYVVLFPAHNWRLKHCIWVAFGVQASTLQEVDLPEAAKEKERPIYGPALYCVPALQMAAERRFPKGTLASDVSNCLARVLGSASLRMYE